MNMYVMMRLGDSHITVGIPKCEYWYNYKYDNKLVCNIKCGIIIINTEGLLHEDGV